MGVLKYKNAENQWVIASAIPSTGENLTGIVKYTSDQTLTETEQLRAQKNIGLDDVLTSSNLENKKDNIKNILELNDVLKYNEIQELTEEQQNNIKTTLNLLNNNEKIYYGINCDISGEENITTITIPEDMVLNIGDIITIPTGPIFQENASNTIIYEQNQESKYLLNLNGENLNLYNETNGLNPPFYLMIKKEQESFYLLNIYEPNKLKSETISSISPSIIEEGAFVNKIKAGEFNGTNRPQIPYEPLLRNVMAISIDNEFTPIDLKDGEICWYYA